MSSVTNFASSVTFGENAVNAAPALLDADVTFTAPGVKFADGTLTVSGLLAEDRVTIRNQGSGAGQIGIFGSNITYGGVAIGTFSGGVGDTFTVLFNSAAKPAAIDALIQNLTYANVSDTPAASRTLTLDVVDAAGAHLHTAPAAFSELTGAANPFNGLDVGLTACPTFADLDGDGDVDAVIGDDRGNLRTFFNTGGVFAERTGTANPFNGLNFQIQSTPSFVDIDGDGDMDAVIGLRYSRLRTFINAGGVFTERTGADNPFNGADAGAQIRPAFLDLDGDGDIDAVTGGRFGALHAFFNTGGVFTERTGTANPVANIDVGYQSAPGVVDLDGDGDLDIVVGTGQGTLRSFFNTNGAFAERTGVDNPFAGIDIGYQATPSFVDIDGDGDVDVVVGASDGTVHTFTNTAARGAAILVNVTPESDVPTLTGLAPAVTFGENAVNAAPALLDASVVFDGGSRGLGGGVLTVSGLLAEDRVGILNEGDGAGQIGVSGTTVSYGGVAIGTISGGSGTAFTVVLNAYATTPAVDALIEHLTYANFSESPTETRTLTLDLVDAAGAQLNAQRATFTEMAGVANPFDGIVVGINSAPSFVDLDDDGDLDLVVGARDGTLRTFVNADGVFSEATGAANPFDGVDVGYTAKPAFADLDGDGDLDAIVGNRAGLRSFFNTDGAFIEQTGAANPFDAITGYNSAPSFVDLDGDSDLDLVVGDFDGKLRSFFNDGNVFTERTGSANPFNGADASAYSAPAFIDLDGDGDQDAVVGIAAGFLLVYSNDGGVFTYSNIVLRDAFASLIDAGIMAAPAFIDLDGDGDLDLALGSNYGTVRAIENLTPHTTITVNVTAETDVPVLTGLGPSVTFAENTVNAAPALLDGDVSFAGTLGFDGGKVVVSGLLAEDRVAILNEGTAAGQIGVSDTAVSYGGTVIGTAAGGDGTSFTVTLNASASAEVIEALIEHLTYANTSDAPTASRALTVDVIDGAGNLANAGPAAFTGLAGSANPLGGIDVGDFSAPALVDLDGDGDLDAVVGGYSGTLRSFLNTRGTFTEATGAANPLGGIDVGSYSAPSFADLDGDGDLDAVVGDRYGILRTYLNTGNSFVQASGAANPFDGIDVGVVSTPSFGDIDGDGDLDVVVGDRDGTLRSFLNAGGVFTEATGAANPFNGIDVGYFAAASFVDLDGDGDLDAVVGDRYGILRTYLNTGGKFTEAAGAANPLSGIDVGYVATPSFGDLDGDGDLDTVIGALDGKLRAFTNTASHGATIVVSVTPQNDAPTLTGFGPSVTLAENAVNAAPALLDGDVSFAAEAGVANGRLTVSGLLGEDRIGIRDEGDGAGQIGFDGATIRYGGVEIGTAAGGDGGAFTVTLNGAATVQAVDALIENLTYANVSDTPTDSRTLSLDVVDAVGAHLNATLASFAPVYGADNPLGGVATGYRSTPAFVDLDGDGDLDLVVGNSYGALQSFFNANGVFTEATGSANPFDGLDVGYNSTVRFVDLDVDGTLDAVVGDSNGMLRTFYNFDGTFTEGTGGANPFDGVDVGTNATAAFVDLDGDGDLDAVIGNGDGMLRSFITNVDGTVTEATGAANPFDGFDVGDDASPSFVDLDGDGDLDAVVGNQNGQLRSFFNTDGVFAEATGSANPFDRVNVGFFAAPSFVDLDGDGDMDVVVGNRDRVLQTYLNTTPHGVSIDVTVTPETDVPTLSGLVSSLAFAENAVNAAPALIDADVVFDAGSSGLGSGMLSVQGLLAEDLVGVHSEGNGAGQIGVSGATVSYGGVAIGTISGGVGTTLSVTLTASATTTAVDALIQNLTYANASDTPTASRTLTIDVTDSVGAGLASGPQSITIAVTAENDGGSLTGLAAAVIFAENAVNAAPALIDANVAFVDPEGNLAGGALTVSGVLAEDRIDVRNQGMAAGQIGVSGANITYGGIAFATFAGGAGAALTVTFNSAATSAAVDALIQNLTYANISNAPTNSRPLTIAVTDADGAALAGGAQTIVVGVTAETDGPGTAIGAIVFENRAGVIPPPAGGATPTSVNGVALTPGDSVTLASGAIVTLNQDGSLTYDPNGKFAYLVAAATAAAAGAINGQASDRFAITLSDGSTKSVAVSIAGVGGSGDQLWFQGDHAGAKALVFDAGDLARIATVRLLSGAIGQYGDTAHNAYDYDLTIADAALAAGRSLTVDGRSLRAGETLRIDGSVETDGRFVLLGGDGDDHLTGGARADSLNGGGGADLLVGGGGNDTYSVDDARDQVVEAIGGGVDRVIASTGYVLAAGSEIELLRTTDDTGVTLAGNEFANHLIGGNGNDRLDGGAGADILAGGRGNDTYAIDDAGDRAIEQPGAGVDIVETTLSRYVLPKNVEVLRFTGDGDFNGTGNAADNRIVGGAGNDVLQGRDGDDSLLGGGGADKLVGNAGADTLTGGLGADRFQFLTLSDSATGATHDRIADFSHADGDVIDLRLIDADRASAGDQQFRFIGTAAFDGSAGQLRAEQIGGVFVISADTDGDGQANFTFDVVASQPLVAADFQL